MHNNNNTEILNKILSNNSLQKCKRTTDLKEKEIFFPLRWLSHVDTFADKFRNSFSFQELFRLLRRQRV